MLNYYSVNYVLKLNGKEVHHVRRGLICEASQAQSELLEITWGNLADFYQKFGRVCGFEVWEASKGKVIDFYSNPFNGSPRRRKEWRHPELGLTFETVYRKDTPSIRTILEYGNGEKAIQYLRERGLSIG